MKQKAAELKKAYSNRGGEAREHLSKLEELIAKNSMTEDQVTLLIDNSVKAADVEYPELEKIEELSSTDFGTLYKKMSEEVKANPEKFEEHAKTSGMSTEDLAILFAQLNGAVEKYPEVWESKEAAAMLHPKNLSILLDVFKKDE